MKKKRKSKIIKSPMDPKSGMTQLEIFRWYYEGLNKQESVKFLMQSLANK